MACVSGGGTAVPGAAGESERVRTLTRGSTVRASRTVRRYLGRCEQIGAPAATPTTVTISIPRTEPSRRSRAVMAGVVVGRRSAVTAVGGWVVFGERTGWVFVGGGGGWNILYSWGSSFSLVCSGSVNNVRARTRRPLSTQDPCHRRPSHRGIFRQTAIGNLGGAIVVKDEAVADDDVPIAVISAVDVT